MSSPMTMLASTTSSATASLMRATSTRRGRGEVSGAPWDMGLQPPCGFPASSVLGSHLDAVGADDAALFLVHVVFEPLAADGPLGVGLQGLDPHPTRKGHGPPG